MGHDFTKGQSGAGETQLSRSSYCSARPPSVSPASLPNLSPPVAAGGLPGLSLPGYNHGNEKPLPQLSLEFIAKLQPTCQGLGE